MEGNEQLVKAIKKIDEEKREEEIKKYEKIVQDFEELLGNNNELIVKLARSGNKTHVVIEVADAMEHLYRLGKSEVPTNEIATYLVRKLDGYVARSVVWDNLPPRFKSYKLNPDHNERQETEELRKRSENSSLNTDPEKENAAWIITLNNQIEFLRSFRTKLASSHFTSVLDNEERQNLAETLHKVNTIVRLAEKIFDDRQSVPLELQHLLAAAFIESTDNFAAGIYISKVKDFGANRSKEARKKIKSLADAAEKITKEPDRLTPKQATKIILGYVRKVAPIFDPKNRNEALVMGFYGVQCPNPECRSWRIVTELSGTKLSCHCFACEKNFDAKTVTKCKKCYLPFYDEIIEVMKNDAVSIEDGAIKTKCPRCQSEAILPISYLPVVAVRK